jgi:hypothetical protein
VSSQCNYTLGKSTIQIILVGCNWEGKQYIQRGPIQQYLVPAHFLSVQVVEIKDDNDQRKNIVGKFFQNTSPQTQHLTNATDSSVCFQYDGVPKIGFQILLGADGTNQKGYYPADYTKSKNLPQQGIPYTVHVIDSGRSFFFRLGLYYKIEDIIICDMAPDTIKLRILNQVGAHRSHCT